jgi:hypothetical protein
LKKKINAEHWTTGTGLLKASSENILAGNYFVPDEKVIDTNKLNRYYTTTDALTTITKECNPKDLSMFTSPFLLVKEGQREWKLCASIIDYKALFLKSAFAIKNLKNDKINKVICALINSKFAKYYLSLISASWGIERERFQPNEILMLPACFENIDDDKVEVVSNAVDKIIAVRKEFTLEEKYKMEKLENELDLYLMETIFCFSKNEISIIQDAIEYSLDLFQNKEKSAALLPVSNMQPYIKTICQDLNNFLEDQNLFTTATTFPLSDQYMPLTMLKLSFSETKRKPVISTENIGEELSNLDKKLWKQQACNIYFRRKLNYYDGDDIYLIRPNQRRFWTQTAAINDASDLILEILNKD